MQFTCSDKGSSDSCWCLGFGEGSPAEMTRCPPFYSWLKSFHQPQTHLTFKEVEITGASWLATEASRLMFGLCHGHQKNVKAVVVFATVVFSEWQKK